MATNPRISAVVSPLEGWLLFVLTLQGQQPAVRMRVWRGLKTLGAAVLRDGVYLIPNRPKFFTELETQAKDVVDSGGSAQIFETQARDEGQEAEFRKLFDRTADYQDLIKEMKDLRDKVQSTEPGALSTQVTRLRREFEAIIGQDFFPGEAAKQTRRAMEELTLNASRALSPDEPHSTHREIPQLNHNQYQGRSWATRSRPWVDRLASAWLIRRFIDPRAKFLWLKHPDDCPKRALGFDFDGATFTHIDGKVTFEVLMESFGLHFDDALRRIAALVHYLDVGGIPAPEAAGVETLLRGARKLFTDDDMLMAEAAKVFELIYHAYREPDNNRQQ